VLVLKVLRACAERAFENLGEFELKGLAVP
jgi:hypothetical protein